MNPETTTTSEDGKENGKYVHLIGPAKVKIMGNQLGIILLDGSLKAINEANPVILGDTVLIANMHVVAEFDEKQLAAHKDTLISAKQSFVEFRTVSTPEESILPEGSQFTDCMTSTDPPHCNNAVRDQES